LIRFDVQLPIRYRREGHGQWLRGTTVNLNRSGVLFRGKRGLRTGCAVEAVVTLAASAAEVSCRGRIVRKNYESVDGTWFLAAAIECDLILPVG
jgi:hypothetical protein